MAIVAVASGPFTGGERLAEMLGRELRCRVVTQREVNERAAELAGVAAAELAELLERAPTLDELAEQREQRRAAGRRRQHQIVSLQAALGELLGDDSAVFHGRGGCHLLLPRVAHLLMVGLDAPLDRRVEAAVRLGELCRTGAGERIHDGDAAVARWTWAFLGVELWNPLNYDLLLSSQRLGLEEIALLVIQAAELPRFRATEQSRGELADFALAARVRAVLGRELSDVREPVVLAADGVVTLAGVACAERARLYARIRDVDGVRDITEARRREPERTTLWR